MVRLKAKWQQEYDAWRNRSLADQPLRFSELSRAIPLITQKELTKQLRALEAAGLVGRRVHAAVPPKVEYWLTDLGLSLRPVLGAIGFPPELFPLGVLRSLSGSGSLALTADVVKTHGPDSFLARTAATIYGSSETTFYVLAVYFGAVGIKKTRHAVPAALIADAVALAASIVVCRWLFL